MPVLLLVCLIVACVFAACAMINQRVGSLNTVGAALFFYLLMLLLSRAAGAHGWYDQQCCNEGDCRQTAFGEVQRHDDGWFVVSTGTLISFRDPIALKHSQDALIHVCLRNRWSIDPKPVGWVSLPDKFPRCLYIPDPPT